MRTCSNALQCCHDSERDSRYTARVRICRYTLPIIKHGLPNRWPPQLNDMVVACLSMHPSLRPSAKDLAICIDESMDQLAPFCTDDGFLRMNPVTNQEITLPWQKGEAARRTGLPKLSLKLPAPDSAELAQLLER